MAARPVFTAATTVFSAGGSWLIPQTFETQDAFATAAVEKTIDYNVPIHHRERCRLRQPYAEGPKAEN